MSGVWWLTKRRKQWLGLVVFVAFSALILMVGCHRVFCSICDAEPKLCDNLSMMT